MEKKLRFCCPKFLLFLTVLSCTYFWLLFYFRFSLIMYWCTMLYKWVICATHRPIHTLCCDILPVCMNFPPVLPQTWKSLPRVTLNPLIIVNPSQLLWKLFLSGTPFSHAPYVRYSFLCLPRAMPYWLRKLPYVSINTPISIFQKIDI